MLAVGDSTRLEIIFKTGSYRNTNNKSPVIMTNAGPQKYTLQIKSYIFADPDSVFPVHAEPATIAFSDTGEAGNDECYFSLVNNSMQDLRPQLVSLPKSMVIVNLPKSVPPGSFAGGSVKLIDQGRDEIFEKSITIEFNDVDRTRLTIPIVRGVSQNASGQH